MNIRELLDFLKELEGDGLIRRRGYDLASPHERQWPYEPENRWADSCPCRHGKVNQ